VISRALGEAIDWAAKPNEMLLAYAEAERRLTDLTNDPD